MTCQDAPILASEAIAEAVAFTFSEAHRWRTAADILSSGSLASRSEPFATLVLASVSGDHHIPEEDAQYVVARLLVRAEALRAEGSLEQAAVVFYNAGNLAFHSAYEWTAAADAYRAAGELRPWYRKQAYYCAEYAGALFESGLYAEAAEWYVAARSLDPADRKLIAQLADARSHAGLYQIALNLLDEYGQSARADDPAIWTLYREALAVVVGRTSLTVQARRPSEAVAALDKFGASAYREAWQLDALCLEAWSAFSKEEDDENAWLDTLLVTCCFESVTSPAPWGLLLVLLHAAELFDEFRTAVSAAWARNGESMVENVVEICSNLDATLRTPLLQDFMTEVERLRKRGNRLTVRLIDEDGQVQVLAVEQQT